MPSRASAGLLLLGGAAAAAVAARAIYRRRRRWDFTGRTVVIVGGSRGLGLEIARVVRAAGANVALLARDAGELARALDLLDDGPGVVRTYTCDITDRAKVEQTFAQIIADEGRIDALFNVAGVIQVGPLAEMTVDDFRLAMNVHFWGPLHTVFATLPHLRRRGEGRIVNVASIGGKVAVPHLAPYSASKFALVGLSDALRAELAAENIQVTTVAPGILRTGSQDQADFKGRARSERAWFATAAALPLLSMDAAAAARRIVEACRYGESALILTLPAKVLVQASATLPGALAAVLRAAARILPSAPAPDDQADAWRAPSLLTRRLDAAGRRNNETA